MSFSLISDDSVVTWDDGKLSGYPPSAVTEAEFALRRRPHIGATPTGPWFEAGTPKHAWLVLRRRAPQAEVGGKPPVLERYGDELDQHEV